jgi:hypothetical protein
MKFFKAKTKDPLTPAVIDWGDAESAPTGCDRRSLLIRII